MAVFLRGEYRSRSWDKFLLAAQSREVNMLPRKMAFSCSKNGRASFSPGSQKRGGVGRRRCVNRVCENSVGLKMTPLKRDDLDDSLRVGMRCRFGFVFFYC